MNHNEFHMWGKTLGGFWEKDMGITYGASGHLKICQEFLFVFATLIWKP